MNPFNLLKNVRDSYRTYVESYQNFENAEIGEWVRQHIEEGDLLWREPFVELVRGFQRGCEFEDLVQDDQVNLHPETPFSFGDPEDSRDVEPYPLYKHQEQAVRSIIGEENNTVIATGTGSGKTFCFMIPILNRCLKLRDREKEGVKALIIYPMNALANSQYNEFAARLHKTGVTIGLYTGDTEHEKDRAMSDYQERFGRAEPYDSELISRDQMQEAPPDVLMTNYQMLEFILTRREDQVLFPQGQGQLEYIVLDEIHTYSGMRGADVSCLMRRLKEHIGVAGNVRCIGTSATIHSGEGKAETRTEITDFAEDLFGEPFSPENVIEESRIPWRSENRDLEEFPDDVVEEEDLQGDFETLSDVVPLAGRIAQDDLSHVDDASDLGHALYDNPVLAFLEEQCQKGPVSFRELTESYKETHRPSLSKEACRNELIAGLLVGTVAEEKRGGRQRERFVPKIHSFYSQGRSVVSCLSEAGPHLSDRGENVCAGCDGENPAFPLHFCRNCGQEYYSVSLGQDNQLLPAEMDEDERHFYIFAEEWDEEKVEIPEYWKEPHGEVKDTYEDAVPQRTLYDIEQNKLAPETRSGQTRKVTLVPHPFQLCLNCGISYTKNKSEFGKLFAIGGVGRSTATDVIVNSTMESLPEKERKMIVFSDNRQDTALQSSHMNQLRRWIQFRRALYLAVQNQDDGTLAVHTAGNEINKVLEESDTMQNYRRGEREFGVPRGAKNAWVEYLNYVLTEDLRKDALRLHQDLEDGGCLQVDFLDLNRFAAEDDLWTEQPVLNDASGQRRADYIRGILLYMKDKLSVANEYFMNQTDFDSEVLSRIDDDILFDHGYYTRRWPAFAVDQTTKYSRMVEPKSFISTSTNTFQSWTKRFWGQEVDVARDIIRETVQQITDKTEYFEQTPDRSGFMLNPESMILRELEDTTHNVCVDCGNVLHFDTTDQCYRMYCRTGAEEKDLEENYFRQEYLKTPDQSVQISASEHSGQLSGEERQEIEQAFEEEDSETNVIVCTPTMELGIDIGDLSAVMMRNIPPKPSNYAQRAGRAGRDAQPAVISNFCGAGPGRGPHDQYFYRFPKKIISGVIRAPRFHLNNESLIRAHIHAYIFEAIPNKLPGNNNEILDFNESELPLFDDLVSDIQNSLDELESAIVDAIEDAFGQEVREFDWFDRSFIEECIDQFIPRLDQSFGYLREEFHALTRELQAIHEKEESIEDEPGTRRRVEAIKGRRRNIKNGENEFYPLKYLGARGFLPNYAFPRRQVTLSFNDREDDMPRSDLRALNEFAPGNRIYLRGCQYLVTHARTKHSEDEELAYEGYRTCPNCERLYIGEDIRSMTNCEACGAPFERNSTLALEFPDMFARSFSRITIQEEERFRQGYEIQHQYNPEDVESFSYENEDNKLQLNYEQQGSILAANKGLRTRRDSEGEEGFHLCSKCNEWLLSSNALENHLDPENNDYCNNEASHEDIDRNVILYTESQCDIISLQVEPDQEFENQQAENSFLWSLGHTLKNAIIFEFDLEEWEIDVFVGEEEEDRLPSIVLFEADEGGLGVLNDLTEKKVFDDVISRGLELLHVYEEEGCEKACYDCLMSYYNQWRHNLLDRTKVIPFIEDIADATDTSAPTEEEKQKWKEYKEEADSSFEVEVAEIMKDLGMSPPDEIHHTITNPEGTPLLSADFFYEPKTIIMVDGSPHYKDYVQAGDEVKREAVRRLGYEIVPLSGNEVEIRDKLTDLGI